MQLTLAFFFCIFTFFVTVLQRTLAAPSGALRRLPHHPSLQPLLLSPVFPLASGFLVKKWSSSHTSPWAKKHHRKDCKAFRNSQNSFISLNVWVAWGSQGCCQPWAAEVNKIKPVAALWRRRKWLQRSEMTTVTVSQRPHEGHQTQAGVQGKDLRTSCSSWDHIQKVLTGVGCGGVCVCV